MKTQINKKLLIIFFILFFLICSYSILRFYIVPKSRVFHRLVQPSSNIETKICFLETPSGWNTSLNKDFNGMTKEKLVSFTGLLYKYQEYFNQQPYINIRYGLSKFPDRILSYGIGEFIKESGFESLVLEIDSRKVFFWRHKSFEYFSINKSEKVNSKYKTVCIAFCGENFGFYGYFWGLYKDEEDFWNTIKSIKWKNEML